MNKIPRKFLLIIRNEKISSNKISYEKYIKFGITSLLLISEILPFSNTKYNGILHMLKNINEEN